jgi:peptide/nickel transport system ATP-binding protein
VSDVLVEVADLRIDRVRGRERRPIVDGISLRIGRGETIGIVGESGSGKSLSARSLVGLLPPGVAARGSVTYGGRDLLALPERELRRVRGGEIAYLPQDPFTMLNPLRSVERHITEMLRDEEGRPLGRAERAAEAVRRLEEVGITDPGVADRYPFELSGGMRQRVAIAAALALDPKVLIADEPSTALDAISQHRILRRLKDIQAARGMGLALITHDLRLAFSMCDRVYVLYAGSLAEHGPASALQREPMHPYTVGLLLSEPPADRRVRELVSIPGSVPPAHAVVGQCSFAARCEWSTDACLAGDPPLLEAGPAHASACVRLPEIAAELAARRAELAADAAAPPPVGSAPPVLEVRDVEKTFAASRRAGAVEALRGVSLELRQGESLAVVGESGSGKTTLARCLVGLEQASGGGISIDGIDATDRRRLPARDRARLRRAIQYVFQDPYDSLNPALTIGTSLAEALRVAPAEARMPVAELLELVGLPADYARRKPVALSGGERQRVAIARAVAVRPRILVCDEPVSALDVSVQAQILRLLARLRRELGMTLLFITHDLAIVRQVAERVIVMHRGEVVERGDVDRVLDAPQDDYTQRLVTAVPRGDGAWLAAAQDDQLRG